MRSYHTLYLFNNFNFLVFFAEGIRIFFIRWLKLIWFIIKVYYIGKRAQLGYRSLYGFISINSYRVLDGGCRAIYSYRKDVTIHSILFTYIHQNQSSTPPYR